MKLAVEILKKYIKYAGIFVFIYIYSVIDISKVFFIIFNSKIEYLLTSLILTLPQLFLKSYRWMLLMKQQKIIYSPKDSFLIYLSSIYIGVITPGRLGELSKAIYLKKEKNITISKGLSTVIVDRLFDIYLLVVLSLGSVFFLEIIWSTSLSLLLIFIFFITCPLLVLNKAAVEKFMLVVYKISILKRYKKNIDQYISVFYSNLGKLLNTKLLISFILSSLSYTIFFLQCYLIAQSLNISISFIHIVMFMSISNFISFIPISISGLGTRDSVLIYLFSMIGLSSEYAVSMATLVFIIFFVFGGLIGYISFLKRPLDIKNINVEKI